jgi:hypothetical protein
MPKLQLWKDGKIVNECEIASMPKTCEEAFNLAYSLGFSFGTSFDGFTIDDRGIIDVRRKNL